MDVEEIANKVIGCAIEVHRHLGPGLLESTYEAALGIELEESGLKYQRQVPFPAIYKGRNIGEYRVDLIVEDAIVVEIKSVERHDPCLRSSDTHLPQNHRQEGRSADQFQFSPLEEWY